MIKVPWDVAVVILWVGLPAVAIFFLWLFLSIFRVSAKEARQFLTQKGYTNISKLVKDAQGSWVGSAAKDGKTVSVALDKNFKITTK